MPDPTFTQKQDANRGKTKKTNQETFRAADSVPF